MSGPFTDDDARQLFEAMRKTQPIIDTQHAIIKYAEPMAQFLAEAARASGQALGDDPAYALMKWMDVILERAREILKEQGECIRRSGTRSETSMSTLPRSAVTLSNRLLEASANPDTPTESTATKDSSSR